MRITCGGVRGSAQVNHPDFMGFGGDTSSFLIETASGGQILLDLGSGVRSLAPYLKTAGPNPVLRVFFTHYHLDHLSGVTQLPFMYRDGGRLEVYAPTHLDSTARDAIGRLFSPPYWPLRVEDLDISLEYHDLNDAAREIVLGDLRVRWCPSQHPGGSTAYRFEDLATGAAAVIATDLEWTATAPSAADALLALCTQPVAAGVLLMDGQYEPGEFPAKAGWGHSSWRDAVEVARHTGIRRLLITHHDDKRTDTELRAIQARLQRELPGATLARQGDRIEVPA